MTPRSAPPPPPSKPCHYAITTTPLLLLLNPNWPHLFNWMPTLQFVLPSFPQASAGFKAFGLMVWVKRCCWLFCLEIILLLTDYNPFIFSSLTLSLNNINYRYFCWPPSKDRSPVAWVLYLQSQSPPYKWSDLATWGQWGGSHRLKCGQ